MSDDDLLFDEEQDEAGFVATNYLVVPGTMTNEEEFRLTARMRAEQIRSAPMVFEDEAGNLDNPGAFAELAAELGREPTCDEASAWRLRRWLEIEAAYSSQLAAAREAGE